MAAGKFSGMSRLSWFWVALVTAYVVALFQLSDVVFAFVPGGHYNSATRVVLGLTLGVVMWKFLPRAWGRVVVRPSKDRLLVVGVIGSLYLAPVYGGNELGKLSMLVLLGYVLGVSLVGIAEEFLSRGVVFALCEGRSISWAVAVSSITFGAMHFMNLQGGDDLDTVVVQVFGASAIGVMLAGLMIFSRSIWVPIIFHALYNLPFAQFDSVNTGHSAIPISYLIWLVSSALLQIATGVLLIYFADREPVAIKRWLVKFKLIEEVRHG